VKKLILVLFCIGFMVLTSTHCSRSESSRLDESKVILGFWGDETIFFQDPFWSGAENLMFLSFLKEDENGEYQFSLVERWEHSTDYREWTIHIRPGVKWHDGMPVTAADVKFTMDLRIIAAAGGKLPPDLAKILENRVKVIDELTLKMTYENPRKPDGLSVYYPKHLLENLDPKDYREWDFWKTPVGNGPYRYVRHVPKTMVEVEANPDFYRGKPKIQRAILKFVQSSSIQELLSGNIDTYSGIRSEALPILSGDDRFRFYHNYGQNWIAIHWNHPNNPQSVDLSH
jgi:peptide/nickel transport system substrate-binding protein